MKDIFPTGVCKVVGHKIKYYSVMTLISACDLKRTGRLSSWQKLPEELIMSIFIP